MEQLSGILFEIEAVTYLGPNAENVRRWRQRNLDIGLSKRPKPNFHDPL
jgi:hypothetical protein